MRKPRKIGLSRVQSRVLRLLEEAGDEDVPTLVATVKVSEGELLGEIEALERLGYVCRETFRGIGGEQALVILTAMGRAALTAHS